MIKKFIKKLLVSLRKRDKAYEVKETSYGELDTEVLDVFSIPTLKICRILLYQKVSNSSTDSLEELDQLYPLLRESGIRYIQKSNNTDTILIISGELTQFQKLDCIYRNNFQYAYNKHLKLLLKTVQIYKNNAKIGRAHV